MSRRERDIKKARALLVEAWQTGMIWKLRPDKAFNSEGCGETIYVSWRPMKARRKEPPEKG